MEFKFDELRQLLEKSEGFMINITTKHNTNLNHYFFSEKFPEEDMLPSSVEGEKLIVNRLKNRRKTEDAEIIPNAPIITTPRVDNVTEGNINVADTK